MIVSRDFINHIGCNMAHKNRSNQSPMGHHKGAHLRQGRHKKPQEVLSRKEAEERLTDIFYNHEFGHISSEVRSQLVQFYEILMAQQQKENFTRLLSFRDIAIKHFIDCLIVADKTKLTFPLLDMGTGPGFPGIPLRMIIPKEHKIILAEGVQKRVEFLKQAREELKLENLDILGKNITPEFVYPVGGVITRAVEDVGNTLKNVLNCLKIGGKVFLMKGPQVDPEIKPALEAWGEYFKLSEDIPYSLPHSPHERRLLVFTKIKSAETIPQEDLDDDDDF